MQLVALVIEESVGLKTYYGDDACDTHEDEIENDLCAKKPRWRRNHVSRQPVGRF